MRDFLNVDMFYQVASSTIALFHIYTIIADKIEKIYENNGSVIRIGIGN